MKICHFLADCTIFQKSVNSVLQNVHPIYPYQPIAGHLLFCATRAVVAIRQAYPITHRGTVFQYRYLLWQKKRSNNLASNDILIIIKPTSPHCWVKLGLFLLPHHILFYWLDRDFSQTNKKLYRIHTVLGWRLRFFFTIPWNIHQNVLASLHVF